MVQAVFTDKDILNMYWVDITPRKIAKGELTGIVKGTLTDLLKEPADTQEVGTDWDKENSPR